MTARSETIVCTPKSLPSDQLREAARVAMDINPANRPYLRPVAGIVGERAVTKEFICALTSKYWQPNGVHLQVRFLDTNDKDLKNRIISHMNAWSEKANISFKASQSNDAQVRIARTPGDGYWSYLGTDIGQISSDEPTMNLDSFGMNTDESEYKRVVRHETGHTLGFPHEHLRREVVDRIDKDMAVRYFYDTCGWSKAVTIAQVLTPLEELELIEGQLDTESIMCYQLSAYIMKDGTAVPGGLDIDKLDRIFVQRLYPMPARGDVRNKQRARSLRKPPAGVT
ncbi:M12 family metallopeptidase [Nocardia vaccinii]|uniref:M12 family metallopeptidase n=1 Tax=Nocardia vaccinii TaxID=1822 RepID=UPI000A005DB9|nr:M12 family metallopeptidase [Nocardia vaccinii]